MKGWLLGALLLVPQLAHAELYSYTDAAGIVHFTNIVPSIVPSIVPNMANRDSNRLTLPQSDNTWVWEDDAGQLQRLHRVDISAFDPLIEAAALYYSLPPALIKAVIAVESNFETRAISPAGARGLMQLLPATGVEMFVERPFEASDNIFGGTRYLRILANRFSGDIRLTAAAYNCGPEAVERAGGVPNIAETQAYVRRVLVLYRHYLIQRKAAQVP